MGEAVPAADIDLPIASVVLTTSPSPVPSPMEVSGERVIRKRPPDFLCRQVSFHPAPCRAWSLSLYSFFTWGIHVAGSLAIASLLTGLLPQSVRSSTER